MNYNLNEETKSLRELYDIIENEERFKAILLKIKSKCGRGLEKYGLRKFLSISEPNLEVELNLNGEEASVYYIVYNWEKEQNAHHEIYSTLDRKNPEDRYMMDPYTGIVAGRLLDLFKIIEQQEVFYSK